MYKSKEIRWFFKEPNQMIEDWISKHDSTLAKAEERTDFYLPLPDKDDLTVKLREGNIELKMRQGQPALHALTPTAIGKLEQWVKWSFDVNKQDSLVTDILGANTSKWIKVAKTRIGVKLVKDGNGIKTIRIKERAPYGVQVEYTKITVDDNKPSYTFCFEWFGDDELKIDEGTVQGIIGSTTFVEKDSMGYGEFLR